MKASADDAKRSSENESDKLLCNKKRFDYVIESFEEGWNELITSAIDPLEVFG